jgi:CspA family cold shock protein
MASGTVKWFNATKGYGFISPAGGGSDVFVHITAVQAAGLQGLNDGQQIALNAIQSRFAEQSGVSVDQEMSDLVELQNAYAANARVISAVKELMDVLLRI